VGLTLRLLRHGRTEWSDTGRYTGHADVGLTASGRKELAAVELPPTDYASVVASDLRRCQETAELIGVAAVSSRELREFDFGRMEGATWDDLDSTTQAALLAYDDFVAPGGESVEAFGTRVDSFVAGLADGHHLLITHGGVIHHLLRREGVARHIAPGEWIDLELSRR
jgi:2,3-bisphosphoglycerate-dependent phosphoglycerate mutase